MCIPFIVLVLCLFWSLSTGSFKLMYDVIYLVITCSCTNTVTLTMHTYTQIDVLCNHIYGKVSFNIISKLKSKHSSNRFWNRCLINASVYDVWKITFFSWFITNLILNYYSFHSFVIFRLLQVTWMVISKQQWNKLCQWKLLNANFY